MNVARGKLGKLKGVQGVPSVPIPESRALLTGTLHLWTWPAAARGCQAAACRAWHTPACGAGIGASAGAGNGSEGSERGCNQHKGSGVVGQVLAAPDVHLRVAGCDGQLGTQDLGQKGDTASAKLSNTSLDPAASHSQPASHLLVALPSSLSPPALMTEPTCRLSSCSICSAHLLAAHNQLTEILLIELNAQLT